MSLQEFRNEMLMCCRCSDCKFIPLEKIEGLANASICPSISRYNFHTYSGGGRLNFAMALLERKIDYSPKLLEVIYNCQMCGGCDISCKYGMDMDVLDPICEMRIECVNSGYTLRSAQNVISLLTRQATMVPGQQFQRGQWSAGLDVKEYLTPPVDVVFHAGCRTCFDPEMWTTARNAVRLLQKAGLDVGIGGSRELCCGSRAYQMGYLDNFLDQARINFTRFNKCGAHTLVTACADCYYGFKVLADKYDIKGDMEVLHISELLSRLIKNGKLIPEKRVDLEVTWHDPCHLGRLGEPYIHWQGKQIPGQIRIFDPPREFHRGTFGVYQPPRDILNSIPGLVFSEMYRRKEYAWCCGAGGGVSQTNPEFARWTALERLKEAELSGAKALVSGCPGCEQSFRDAVKTGGSRLAVYDIVDILAKSVGVKGD